MQKIKTEETSGIVTLNIGKRRHAATWVVWMPGIPVPEASSGACDSETHEIIEGEEKVPVIGQFYYPSENMVHIVPWYYLQEYLEECHQVNPDILWYCINAAFEMDVFKWRSNMFMEKLERNQVLDLPIRYYLQSLAKGRFVEFRQIGMAFLAKKLLGIEIEKDDDIRLTFHREKKISLKHLEYAALDAVITWHIALKLPDRQPTEFLQTRASVCLQEIQNNGLLVDKEEFYRLKEEISESRKEAEAKLALYGYRAGVKGNSTRLQNLMANLEERYDVKFKRTEKTGMISTKRDDIQHLDGKIPLITNWLTNSQASHLLNHFFKDSLIREDNRYHPRFNIMVSSGRTSSSRPNAQNFPKKWEIRGQIYAPRGYVIGGADYDQLEMCVLAQSCLDRFGHSTLADLINSGVDTHLHMAQSIVSSEGKSWDLLSEDEVAFYRQFSKAANFGFPGGLGAETFVTYAAGYNVDIDIEKAKEVQAVWKKTLPEMEKHLNPEVDEYWSDKKFRQYCRKKDIPDSVKTVEDLKFYLKMQDMDDSEVFEEVKGLSRYIYRTISGRIKRNNTFCTACNGHFQPDAADGGKVAMWRLITRGVKVINFIHDEFMWENLIHDNMMEDVDRVVDDMVTGMRTIIKDIHISAEACMMTRWHKKAKPVFAGHVMVPWHTGIVPAKKLNLEDEKAYREYADKRNMRILYKDREHKAIYGLEEKGSNPIYMQAG